ncbi:unnamed protein product [Urochloa decumbens]|uniref:DUF4005 domain-containing protein n=1 Tax=Urochloa decumbens TaxID=240449 RepID=A0ABC8WK49_9POAL
MGRAMRWLKKVLTGTKKDGEKDRKEHGNAACATVGGLGLGPPPVEKKRWSFAKPRHSVADGGRRPSVTAVAAGELSQVRPCNCGMEREVEAAVVIQKAFRGYLARKALRALKSLVKLQALVRGFLVRKQAATTLRRLQALMRLQAKTASSRKSVEQERIVARVKPVALAAAHRRRLSDGGDTGFDRSPRIVEMDTCQLRCLSSRITSRYAAEPAPGASSPLVYFPSKPASRLQGQWLRELEPAHPKTTHNTPRLGAFPGYLGSPAAAVAKPPGRAAACRDAGGSPRYMADTASSVARTRCQSTPRQRQSEHAAAETRPSVRRGGSRKQALDSFSFNSSEVSRVEGSELSDEVTRDYYLDRLW